MGAHFTRLLQTSASFRDSVVAFLKQFWLLDRLSKFELPWPPHVKLVRRFAPYFVSIVIIPKTIFDVAVVARRPAIDIKLENQATKKLTAALLKSNATLYAFRQASVVLPPFLVDHKQKICSEIDAFLSKHNPTIDQDIVASVEFIDEIVPGLAAGTITFPELTEKDDDDTQASIEGDGSSDESDEGGAAKDTEFPVLTDGTLGGAPRHDDGKAEEDLNTFFSNLKVAASKIDIPSNPAHELHVQAVESKILLTMIMDLYYHMQNLLAMRKTEHYSQFSEEAIARAHNSGEAKRWRTGKPLADLWISNARHPWWEIIHPRHLPKSVPVDRAHWDIRKRAGQPSSRFYGRSSQLRKTMVHHLVLLERAFSDQDKIVKRLQTSKMQKILKFVRYIIGGPWNWAMVAANWLVKALQGMISGAGLYYRSQLLIVAQQFALKAASGVANVDLKPLTDIAFAIIITELARVTVNDAASRVEFYGTNAIRRRLRNLIIEKALSQDLEDFERNKNSNFGHSSYRRLLHAFPIRKFIDLPATFLQSLTNGITTGVLLWSKNWYLFCVVFATYLAEETLRTQLRNFQQWLATYLGVYADHSGNGRDTVNIYQALSNFEDVRINGTEDHHLEMFRQDDVRTGATQLRSRSYTSIFTSLYLMLSEGPNIVTYIVGCSLIATGSLQPADLATFPPSVSRIIRDYRQLQNRYEMLFDFNDWDIKQLDEIVEILSEQPSIGIHGGDTPKLEDFEASIEFKDVAFHRPKWPIRQQGVSFKAPAGSFVALCGKNGVGKSTLFRLMLRLYDADEGAILLGGRDIKEFNPIWLRSRAVSMAVQKPGIYHSTLRANCVYGAEYKSEKMSSDTVVDAAIEKVLKRSGTYEMFKDSRTFAQGFDTVKSHMSGGQERAIGLARALFKESKILLLDEPTNDLDPDRQQAVKESLIQNRPEGQTILCITHDLSTIQDADIILFFEKSKDGITTISAKGTYEELVKLSGPFKKWHDYKWGNHNTNVALGSDIDTNNSVPDGDNSEISTDMATMAVGTSPTRREQYLREQLDELHELQQKVQLARKPILRSHDDFSLLAGSLRYRLDLLPPSKVARLVPQYESLLRQMRLIATGTANGSWNDLMRSRQISDAFGGILEGPDDVVEDEIDDDVDSLEALLGAGPLLLQRSRSEMPAANSWQRFPSRKPRGSAGSSPSTPMLRRALGNRRNETPRTRNNSPFVEPVLRRQMSI